MTRLILALAVVFLCSYTLATPVNSKGPNTLPCPSQFPEHELLGRWIGSCTTKAAYSTASPDTLSCIPGGASAESISYSYTAVYGISNALHVSSWTSTPGPNVTSGADTFYYTAESASDLGYVVTAAGRVQTDQQPCFFVDIVNNTTMTEYGQYYTANYTATDNCPITSALTCADANPLDVFTYSCTLTRVVDNAPTAPSSAVAATASVIVSVLVAIALVL